MKTFGKRSYLRVAFLVKLYILRFASPTSEVASIVTNGVGRLIGTYVSTPPCWGIHVAGGSAFQRVEELEGQTSSGNTRQKSAMEGRRKSVLETT